MKFVLLTQYYPPEVGGAQVLLSSFAVELNRQGAQVRVVTALPNYPTGRIFEGYRRKLFVREVLDGIPVFRSWVYPAQSARMLPRLANYFSFCLSAFLAFFWMGKPDVIFMDSPPLFLALTALVLARLKGARWVMNVSDLWPDAVADSGLVESGFLLRCAERLERFLYRHADFVGTVTQGIGKTLVETKGVPEDKLLFLPIGVDTDLFRSRMPDRTLLETHQLTGKSVFIYAGTLGYAQGLPLLIEAADALRIRDDIAFVFVGDGPVKDGLRALQVERRLTNVVFAEPIPLSEMPRWWSIARGALVPLKDQPIHLSARPSKSLPALASGVPVIYSGRGEMAQILQEAEAGLVVPPEQCSPLVESILRLTDDPGLAQQIGQNGRRLCEQEFSWSRVVQRWLYGLCRKLPAKDHVRAAASLGSVDNE